MSNAWQEVKSLANGIKIFVPGPNVNCADLRNTVLCKSSLLIAPFSSLLLVYNRIIINPLPSKQSQIRRALFCTLIDIKGSI